MKAILRVQLKLFTREKGMLVFYILFMAAAGIAVPYFFRNIVISLNMAAVFTSVFLRPVLAEAMAGEREKRTLEPLLSTPVTGRGIIFAKFLFSAAFPLYCSE